MWHGRHSCRQLCALHQEAFSPSLFTFSLGFKVMQFLIPKLQAAVLSRLLCPHILQRLGLLVYHRACPETDPSLPESVYIYHSLKYQVARDPELPDYIRAWWLTRVLPAHEKLRQEDSSKQPQGQPRLRGEYSHDDRGRPPLMTEGDHLLRQTSYI